MKSLLIQTDGGSRGNPGQAAIGVVVIEDDQIIARLSKGIGIATNNEAEYQAFSMSLEWLKFWQQAQKEKLNIEWQLDSKLVVEQLNRRWKIKDDRMKNYAQQIWAKLSELDITYSITHIPRSQNSLSDGLVNVALDSIN